jgi:hypothetical protein
MKFTLGGDLDVVNINHWLFTGPASAVDMQAFAEAISFQFHAAFSSHLSAALSLTDVETIDLTTTSSHVGDDPTVRAMTGGDPSVPAEVAIVVSQHIARRYRGGKPRTYLAGAQRSGLASPQLWDPAYVTQIDAAWQTFLAAVISTYGSLAIASIVNVSYFRGFTVVINPITGRARNVPTLRGAPVVDVITSHHVNPRPGSQRRRSLQSA